MRSLYLLGQPGEMILISTCCTNQMWGSLYPFDHSDVRSYQLGNLIFVGPIRREDCYVNQTCASFDPLDQSDVRILIFVKPIKLEDPFIGWTNRHEDSNICWTYHTWSLYPLDLSGLRLLIFIGQSDVRAFYTLDRWDLGILYMFRPIKREDPTICGTI